MKPGDVEAIFQPAFPWSKFLWQIVLTIQNWRSDLAWFADHNVGTPFAGHPSWTQHKKPERLRKYEKVLINRWLIPNHFAPTIVSNTPSFFVVVFFTEQRREIAVTQARKLFLLLISPCKAPWSDSTSTKKCSRRRRLCYIILCLLNATLQDCITLIISLRTLGKQ